ncbi:MAG: hypothetical protein IJ168_07210 [Eubacterium sp.]|nr:hypothetical protein [Eubacterium sp.]
MLYTVIDLNDILYSRDENRIQRRQDKPSTNPFDYIRTGYYLDRAALFGGQNYVNYHFDIPGNSPGDQLHHTHQ